MNSVDFAFRRPGQRPGFAEHDSFSSAVWTICANLAASNCYFRPGTPQTSVCLEEKVQPRGCYVSHAPSDISNNDPRTDALIKSRCASLRQVCCWLSPRLYSKQWLPETKRLYDAPNSTKAEETQYNLLELRSFGSAWGTSGAIDIIGIYSYGSHSDTTAHQTWSMSRAPNLSST